MTRWYIKRRPTRRSYFRDAFPYFEKLVMYGGSLWVSDRRGAKAFTTLSAARTQLKILRRDDKHIRIVRVSSDALVKKP